MTSPSISQAPTSPTTCDECGAGRRSGTAIECEFCGVAFPVQYGPTPGATPHAQRFRALHEYSGPLLRPSQNLAAAGKAPVLMVVFGICFFVAWITIGSVIIKAFTRAPGPMVLFPIMIVLFGAGAMLASVFKYQKFRSHPITQRKVLIVDSRISVRSNRDGRARSTHFTTVEDQRGRREELITLPEAVPATCRGDMGIAHLRGSTLIHFGRVPV